MMKCWTNDKTKFLLNSVPYLALSAHSRIMLLIANAAERRTLLGSLWSCWKWRVSIKILQTTQLRALDGRRTGAFMPTNMELAHFLKSRHTFTPMCKKLCVHIACFIEWKFVIKKHRMNLHCREDKFLVWYKTTPDLGTHPDYEVRKNYLQACSIFLFLLASVNHLPVTGLVSKVWVNCQVNNELDMSNLFAM